MNVAHVFAVLLFFFKTSVIAVLHDFNGTGFDIFHRKKHSHHSIFASPEHWVTNTMQL